MYVDKLLSAFFPTNRQSKLKLKLYLMDIFDMEDLGEAIHRLKIRVGMGFKHQIRQVGGCQCGHRNYGDVKDVLQGLSVCHSIDNSSVYCACSKYR